MTIAPSRVVFLLAAFAALLRSGWAQSPGPNVNVMNPAPGSFTGDIFERQVETDIAASPVNSGRAMAGFITYQTLSSAPPASAWCGYSVTNNGGKTWSSNLVPGFPQDTSAQGTSSPLRALGLQQCSDPALAAAPPNATDPAQIYYGALGLTQGGLTAAFVMTFQDPDDGSGHFNYLRTLVTDSGNPSFNGQVMDKPSITYDPPSPGFPQGIVHFVWVDFNGTAKSTKFQSKVMYSRSTDGGRTFSSPVKLNNTFGQNQGTAIARTANGTIYVVWRTFNTESGMQVVSISRTNSISAPTAIAGGTGFFPYDQPTLPDAGSPNYAAFRSNAFPTITADGNATIYVAWPEYVDSSGNPASPGGSGPLPLAIPKIVITSSSDGLHWAQRHSAVSSPANAVQVQPVLKAGGGVITLFYYDSTNDTHPQVLNFINEYQQWVYTGSGVGTDSGIDRQIDAWVTQATSQNPSGLPVFGTPVQVSQYTTSTSTGQIVPRTPGFTDPAINLPNVKTTSNGTVPFVGDYPGMAPAVEFLPSGGGWRLANQPGDYQARTFYTVWTDTRNVEFPGFSINGNWGPYNPASCINPGTRNTKVFFSAISPGLIARFSGTTRPVQVNGAPVPPAFALTVENTSAADRFFQLSINDNTPSEDWSFVQTLPLPAVDPPDSNTIDVQILQSSSVTFGVFYRWQDSTNASPKLPVVITVQEVDGSGNLLAGGLTTSLTFSPSGSAIQLPGSTLQALGVSGQSVSSLTGITADAAQPSDPTVQNFGFKNFGFKNFGFKNFPPDTDVTWTVSGQGLLPTSGNAFVNVSGVQDALNSGGYTFSLFVYATHSTPALSGCTPGQLLQDYVLSNIPIGSTSSTQLVTDFGFKNFGFKNFPPPDISNATFVADQSGIHVTLRSNKDPNQPSLFNPTPTNGVVSEADVTQAVNPGATGPSAAFNDTTPPVITPIITGTQGKNGWYTTAVTVTWNVNDPGSGIASQTGCDTFTQTADTMGVTITCSATNGAGLSNSASVTIKIDTTPPTVTASISPKGPAPTGWYNIATGRPVVTFTCTDTGSGVASTCPAPVVVGDGANQTISSGVVTDAAGNVAAPVSISGINVDLTPPTITLAPNIGPAATGWYNLATGKPTFNFTCSDATSGISPPCPAPVILNDGANQTVSGNVKDVAGNSSVATQSGINVDTTPPTITAAISPNSPAATGWYNAATGRPTVTFTCIDNISGLAAPCPSTVALSDGANQTVSRSITDKAGNTGSATLTGINVDALPPSITVTAPANVVLGTNTGTYLLNASLPANYSCFDAVSGLAACQAPVNSGVNFSTSAVGANTFMVTATDKAGNVAGQANIYAVVYKFALNPPKSPANLGSAVPLSWTLMDANNTIITDMTSLVTISSLFNSGQPANGPCVASLSGTSPTLLYSPATGAAGGSNLRQVSNGFQFNWASSTANNTGKGCYTVVIQLRDDTGPAPGLAVLDPSRLHLASVQLN